MRVVVIGGTGNVGSAVVGRLVADPGVDSVRVVARRRPESGWPDVEVVAADVASDDLVPLVQGADAVVHLAWLFQPTHDPGATWRANVGGTGRVLAAVAAAGVPALVVASSVAANSPHPRDEPVDESWPTDSVPTAAYGREKAYVERMLDAFECRHPDVRVVRLRTGFVFQPASASQQRRLFAGPLAPTPLLRLGLPPVLPYPRGLRFQALHTSDAASGYHLAVTRPVRGAFNLAADPVLDSEVLERTLGCRMVHVAPRLVEAALGVAWVSHLVPAPPALFALALGLPVMTTGRARAELGWHPVVPAVDAVRQLVEGLAGGRGGATPPLAGDGPGGRLRELATGVGSRP
jgi:nucleoside-diphosphate-sugar epimerase